MLTYAEVSTRRAAIREGRNLLLKEMADDTPEGELKPGQMLAAEWLLEWQTAEYCALGSLAYRRLAMDADAIFDHGRRAA